MKPILLLSLLLVGLDAGAQEMAPRMDPCPDEFPMEAIKLSPPKEWVGMTPAALKLTSVELMYGPPRDPGARLIGQQRNTRDGHEVSFDVSHADPNGKWTVCRYGDLALAQRLPDETDRCTVHYYRRPARRNYDIDVACHLAASSASKSPTAPR